MSSGDAKKEVELSDFGWPKTVPDFESAGACYVGEEQLGVSGGLYFDLIKRLVAL